MIEAVCFDLDDTLYPYDPCNEAGKAAARAAARERSYDFDSDGDGDHGDVDSAFEAFYQRGRQDVKRDLTGTAASHERLLYFKRALEHHTGRPQPADALALGGAFWDGYLEAMEPFPETLETLETIRDRGLDVAIVTNLTTRVQLRKLEALELPPLIDCLITSEEVGQEKPASVPFTLALSRLGVDVADALMVGDSIASDVVGANALGIESVWLDHRGVGLEGVDTDGPYGTPDHRIESLGAVTDLL